MGVAHSAKPETTCSGMWGEVPVPKGHVEGGIVILDHILKPWQATNLPAMQQGLPHITLDGHFLRADQPVGDAAA